MFGLDFTNFSWDLSNPIILGVTITIAGWIVTGMYAYVNQWQNMKRQLVLDVAKIKLKKIHNSSIHYTLMASSARTVHELICASENNEEPCLYYTCKFFRSYVELTRKFGGIGLDNLDGERAIKKTHSIRKRTTY